MARLRRVRHLPRCTVLALTPATGCKEHTVGDIDCPGCGVVNGIRYPHPHHEGPNIIHLEFLVHGEAFQYSFDQYCEGGCALPRIELAPKPRKKPPTSADLLCQLDLVRDTQK